jgi:hypothetical protein
MEDPVHYWTPSIATSGMIVYTGDRFPNWRGSVLVGGLAGTDHPRVVARRPARVVAEETLLSGYGRVRDIRQGPDGYIYVAIDHRSPPRARTVLGCSVAFRDLRTLRNCARGGETVPCSSGAAALTMTGRAGTALWGGLVWGESGGGGGC